jgi:threonine synthase
MMGLPICKLIVATNENDVLDEFFKTGIYRTRKSSETYHTTSPSMDISKASNFERFIFDLLNRDSGRVAELFSQVQVQGGFDLSPQIVPFMQEQFGFYSGRSSHRDRIETIQSVARKYQVVIDPHTADGVKVAKQHLDPGVKMLVLETALPIKFAQTIAQALGHEPDRPSAFDGIEKLPQRVKKMSLDVLQVKQFIEQNT